MASDGTFEEANHMRRKPVRSITEDIVTRVLRLEQLRSPCLVVPVPFDYGIRAIIGAEEVACAKDECNREVKVLQHLLLSHQIVF